MRAIVLILLSLSLSSTAFAQIFKYEGILMNKKIGEMNVIKTNSEGSDRYILNSESIAKILFVKQSAKVSFDVLYNKGALVKSLYVSEKEDENIITKIHKESDLYKINSNNILFNFKGNIEFSSIMLYFKEPIGVTKVFVERIGKFVALTKTAASQYEYLQPDGTTCIFRYQAGLLKELEIKRGMGSVFIRKVA